MKLTWSEVTTADLPVEGYILQMDDGFGGEFTTIYDGSTNPQQLFAEVVGLTQSRTYRFKVAATDVNGIGELSSQVSLIACTPPSGFD